MMRRSKLPRGAAEKATEQQPADQDAPARLAADPSVPRGMVIAGAWSWRVLLVVGVVAVFVWLVIQLRIIVIPFLVALLVSALLVPFSAWLQRHRWPKWVAVVVSLVGFLVVVAGLFTLVVLQIVDGWPALRDRSIASYEELRQFLLASPLHLTEGQLNGYVRDALAALQQDSQPLLRGALSIGSTAGHVGAGLVLTLFTTIFLLVGGGDIWRWVVRMFPRAARDAVDGAGRAGWLTLTNFVKVQIFVAFVDAVGIGLGALLLGLPLVGPIAIAVFLGSFVPVVGAVATGAIAVLIALVYNGWVVALLMLAVVILVQQIEGHLLQPFVMGSAVKVHPLAVVFAVAAGALLAGIPGALFAVPVVAVLNVMVGYVARGSWRTVPHPTSADVTSPGKATDV
jgi:predicted PurR-regulated permease PerM